MPSAWPPPTDDGERRAGHESASAAAHHDIVRMHAELDRLFDDFQADRALSGDDVRIVEGGHEHRAAFGRETCGYLLAAFAFAIVFDDRCAQRERVLHLYPGGVRRHHDRGRYAEQPGRGGDPLRVVARREGDHPGPALYRVELHETVVGTPELERTRVLQRFELQKDSSAGQRIERRIREQRRAACMSGESCGCRANVVERRQAAGGVIRH